MSRVSVDEAVGGIREGRRDECAGIRRTRRDGAVDQFESWGRRRDVHLQSLTRWRMFRNNFIVADIE